MTLSAAVYTVSFDLHEVDHIHLALTRMRDDVEHLVLVAPEAFLTRFADVLKTITLDKVIATSVLSPLVTDIQTGLLYLQENARETGNALESILISGAHAFGPMGDITAGLRALTRDGTQMFSSYWKSPELDLMMQSYSKADCVPSLDFAIFGTVLLQDSAFWSFWENLRPNTATWRDEIKFNTMLETAGHSVTYAFARDLMQTSDPATLEIHKLIDAECPCVPLSAFMLDPILQDLSAINLRAVLDQMRVADVALYKAMISFTTRHLQMRDFNTICDQYQILSEDTSCETTHPRSFGTIAVFIHAFYATMMPEFWDLIQRLPKAHHLFITTSNDTDRASIEQFLDDHGVTKDGATVRVVAQNRGRDMGSLFISWRDVILSGDYEVALRLHSKRTPQVSPQVGQSFKQHLFENLVASKDYVSNVLDLMEAEPDIGMLIPPVIHIGFGTLGHSWFNNRQGLLQVAADMNIDVPLDDATPVAAYGTMYWFRVDALRKMFETKWDWNSYNAEPGHVDGGLAHIQERLIGYCAQDQGYRVMSIMTPKQAARGYARLEYKLQLLASYLPTGNIHDQRAQMQAQRRSLRADTYRALREVYGQIIRRYPGAHKYLRKPGRWATRLLLPGKSR